MQKIFRHIRICIFNGFLAAIPLVLCIFAVYLLHVLVDKQIIKFLDRYYDVHDIPGFGIIVLVFMLMFIGVVASYAIGQQILQVFEYILGHVPFIKQVYSLTKKVSDVLGQDKDKIVFRKTVLINYPNPDQWSVALVVGKIKDAATGEDWLKVYLPMAHPLVGFIYLVKEAQVRDPGWSAEVGVKMAASFGLIAPRSAL